jgi:DNA-binding NtrC family response regulator
MIPESLKKQNLELQKEGNLLILGNSKVFIDVLNTAKKAAATDANILITGENGTGKEALARYIHKHSLRNEKTFLSVDLNSIPDNLFESEIFGHQKGAFTDAKESRTGKLLAADGGTLFMDEIGNLNSNLQSKLLRSLQNRTVIPLGSNTEIPFDVRLISATNVDIDKKIEDGDFRQDFLYRINTIEIKLPPVRERGDDINLIAQFYLDLFRKKYQKPNLKFTKEILDKFRDYQWPGNIRELKHVVERAVILADDERFKISDFPFNTKDLNDEKESLNIAEMEKSLILKSLEKNKGNITKSAKDLGIDRLALYRRLEKYGL